MMRNRFAASLALLTAAVVICGCAPRIKYDFSLGNVTAAPGPPAPGPNVTTPVYVAVSPNTTAASTQYQLRRVVDRTGAPEVMRLREAVIRLQRDMARMQEELE